MPNLLILWLKRNVFCISLELKAPWPMGAISKPYNRDQNTLEPADILPNVSSTKSEKERDYY